MSLHIIEHKYSAGKTWTENYIHALYNHANNTFLFNNALFSSSRFPICTDYTCDCQDRRPSPLAVRSASLRVLLLEYIHILRTNIKQQVLATARSGSLRISPSPAQDVSAKIRERRWSLKLSPDFPERPPGFRQPTVRPKKTGEMTPFGFRDSRQLRLRRIDLERLWTCTSYSSQQVSQPSM